MKRRAPQGRDSTTWGREIICIPFDHLAGWFFQINENKVKREIKERVILYKQKCYKALDDYFNQGYALNEKILINKPQLREQLVEEIQSLESGFIDINVQEGDIEASYKFIVATRSDGTKVTIHNIKSLLNIIISSGGTTLSEKTLVNKLGLRFPPGHKYRVIARMKGQKGQIPLMIKSEGIVEFLKDNNITVDRDLLVLLINELNDQLKVRRECGDPVFSSGFGDSLVTRTDIVFNYLLESFSRDTGESFLELSDVVYVAELKNGNYYIGALAEQTFKERFLGHDLIKEKNFKSFVALFIPKHKRQSINCFSVEAELHSLISQYTDQRLSAIRSSGSSGFKASPSIIFRALYHSQTLKEFVLIDKEILEGAENYLIGLIK